MAAVVSSGAITRPTHSTVHPLCDGTAAIIPENEKWAARELPTSFRRLSLSRCYSFGGCAGHSFIRPFVTFSGMICEMLSTVHCWSLSTEATISGSE